MKVTRRLAFCAVAVTSALTVHAHETWIEPKPAGGYAIHYGHGSKKEPFDPAKVKELQAFDASGQALTVRRRPAADQGMSLEVAAGIPALITVFFDNGFWSRSAPDVPSRNLPMNQNPGAVAGTHSLKIGKTLLAWVPEVTQPRGLRLEIVPTVAAAPAPGGTLPVQVLWEGKALPGATLTSESHDKRMEFIADELGRVGIPVKAGWQMVVVGHELPMPGDPRADKARFSANLFFPAR